MPGFELVGKEERKAVNNLFDDGGVLKRHFLRPNRIHLHILWVSFSIRIHL